MTSGGKRGASVRKGKRARNESSAGGVVFRYGASDARSNTQENTPLFLVIRDSYGNWGFPKGHVERRERAETAALREVMEETGLRSLQLVGPIATIEWYFQLHGNLIHKNCQYFLMETESANTRPQESEGISACRWVTLDEGCQLIRYQNARGVLQRAQELVTARRSAASDAATG